MNKKNNILTMRWGIIALALAIGLGLYAFRGAIFVSENSPQDVVQTEQPTFVNPLTGVRQWQKPKEHPQIFSVIVDNHPDARPQSGLEDAFLVIEAPVEGGITRFLAYYYEGQEVEKIGPVRSARPYFIDWAQELDALFVHVGGSPKALEQIRQTSVFDLNEYWNGDHFWRDTETRDAPHNVYTSTESLESAYREAENAKRAPTRLYEMWKFAQPSEPITSPDITIGSYSFSFLGALDADVTWEYAVEQKRFARMQDSEYHKMEDGSQIFADSVILIETDIKVIDEIGRRWIATTGGGTGAVLSYPNEEGKVVAMRILWEKESASERLRFFSDEGSELELNPGVTWIEIVPKGTLGL